MSPRLIRSIILSLCLVAITLPAFYCSRKKTPDNTAAEVHESKWRNVYDTSAHYVGMEACRNCHAGVYETFIKTGMGQSFDHATRQKSAADFSPSHALVYDSVLNFYYKPFWQNDTLYVMEFRTEGNDTVHKRTQRIDYIVGSGQHTNSHIFNINGYLYQAPITFYTQKQRWDLAPGFEKGASSRFGRMIELECMSCHNGYPKFVDSSENKYIALKTGIDCERCHGPGSMHVQEKSEGHIIDTSKGPDYSIVNPRRLSTELQNNVCQRCHLQGIAVLNDGKNFFDFHPGMQLSEVMNVFMPEYEGAKDKMIMASHVERMKKSRCYVESGKMSCITCHNPHVSVKYTPRTQYLDACKSCHGSNNSQKQCTEKLAVRQKQNDDCVICHMPHNSSIDIPHVAVTDHFIRRNPASEKEKTNISAFLGMQCFNNKNPDAITTARGYIEFYERYAPSKGLLDSAIKYLGKQMDIEAKQKQNRDYIRVYFLLNDYNKVLSYASELKPETTTDAWSNYRIGEAYSISGSPDKALPWYKRAIELLPYSLDFENKYGVCLLALNKPDEAKKIFEFILTQNPDYVSANTSLGYIYMQNGNAAMAYEYLEKAYALDPDHEQTLINLAVWYHNNKADQQAKKCVLQLLKKHPENKQAQAMLANLNGAI